MRIGNPNIRIGNEVLGCKVQLVAWLSGDGCMICGQYQVDPVNWPFGELVVQRPDWVPGREDTGMAWALGWHAPVERGPDHGWYFFRKTPGWGQGGRRSSIKVLGPRKPPNQQGLTILACEVSLGKSFTVKINRNTF